MKNDRMILFLFKALILILFPLLFFGAWLFSYFLESILRRALKEKGRDKVIRVISYKGLFGIFDLIERKRRS